MVGASKQLRNCAMQELDHLGRLLHSGKTSLFLGRGVQALAATRTTNQSAPSINFGRALFNFFILELRELYGDRTFSSHPSSGEPWSVHDAISAFRSLVGEAGLKAEITRLVNDENLIASTAITSFFRFRFRNVFTDCLSTVIENAISIQSEVPYSVRPYPSYNIPIESRSLFKLCGDIRSGGPTLLTVEDLSTSDERLASGLELLSAEAAFGSILFVPLSDSPIFTGLVRRNIKLSHLFTESKKYCLVDGQKNEWIQALEAQGFHAWTLNELIEEADLPREGALGERVAALLQFIHTSPEQSARTQPIRLARSLSWDDLSAVLGSIQRLHEIEQMIQGIAKGQRVGIQVSRAEVGTPNVIDIAGNIEAIQNVIALITLAIGVPLALAEAAKKVAEARLKWFEGDQKRRELEESRETKKLEADIEEELKRILEHKHLFREDKILSKDAKIEELVGSARRLLAPPDD